MMPGPALDEMHAGQGALSSAGVHFYTASMRLREHLQVKESYVANQDAGDREFVAGAAVNESLEPRRVSGSAPGNGQMTGLGPHEVLEPYDTEVATLMQGFGVGPCPICNRGAEDHTFTADKFNHAHAWCVYADGEATGLVAGQVIEHGPHEVVKACGTPWYHNPADPRHQPGLVCTCGGTGWDRVCTICRCTNCAGVHDWCLNCDGDGKISCASCDGEGGVVVEVKVACPDCEGRTADCGVCDGEGELYEEKERRCVGCKGTGDVTCTVCNGTGKPGVA